MTENKIKCKCCGYEWISKVEIPKQCPKCKRYDYQELKNEMEMK